MTRQTIYIAGLLVTALVAWRVTEITAPPQPSVTMRERAIITDSALRSEFCVHAQAEDSRLMCAPRDQSIGGRHLTAITGPPGTAIR